MTNDEKRSWVYAFAWIGSSMAAGGIAIWLITLIRWDWPADRAEQQITILGNLAYGMVGLMALVILGLSLRNAIKNIKGSVGAASFEANGQTPDNN